MTPKRYLSRPEIAVRIGLKPHSITRDELPEPDAITGILPGWLPETVDDWQLHRPGRGNWGPRSSPQ